MINELLSRPNIQEFLNKYPSDRWKELIADLFEIGVLNLRNSYHRDEYSKKEFRALIYDLEHPSYEPESTPMYYKTKNYYPKYSDYNYNNYDYGRRMRRMKKLKEHSSTSQMDAFYSEKNVVYPNKIQIKKPRRTHQEIMDKINMTKNLRDAQRYEIRDLKMQYLQNRKEELEQKMKEKILEKQAEEEIKNAENEKRRFKQEQDYQEGYGEDYQEEDEIEEEETDKYNDYNRGYED